MSELDDQIKELKNDKWLTRLKPIMDDPSTKTLHHFMLGASFQYILFELEKIPESESINALQDSFKVNELAEKWNITELADYSNRVSLIVVSKVLKEMINIIKGANISDDEKQRMINQVLEVDIEKSWNSDAISGR